MLQSLEIFVASCSSAFCLESWNTKEFNNNLVIYQKKLRLVDKLTIWLVEEPLLTSCRLAHKSHDWIIRNEPHCSIASVSVKKKSFECKFQLSQYINFFLTSFASLLRTNRAALLLSAELEQQLEKSCGVLSPRPLSPLLLVMFPLFLDCWKSLRLVPHSLRLLLVSWGYLISTRLLGLDEEKL